MATTLGEIYSRSEAVELVIYPTLARFQKNFQKRLSLSISLRFSKKNDGTKAHARTGQAKKVHVFSLVPEQKKRV